MTQRQQGGFEIGLNNIISIIIAIGVLVALFFLARAVFTVLAWIAPVLLVLALIINYRTVLNFGKWLWELLLRSPLMGILAILLTFVGFPVVAAFLFGKSFIDRRMRQYMEEQGMIDEYVEYEEVPDEDPLSLPQLDKRPDQRKS